MFGKGTSRADGSAIKVTVLIPIGAALMSAGLVVGYLAGLEQAVTQRGIGYQRATEDIKKKLDESGLFLPQGNMKSLLGQVTGVGADHIDIKVSAKLPVSPLDTQPPAERRVLIGADTKLIRVKAKSLPEAAAEKRAFNDALKKYLADKAAGKSPVTPPPPNTNLATAIELADISPGDGVVVASDNDIMFTPLFLATEIKVIDLPGPPKPGSRSPTDTDTAEAIPSQ